ncbi:unnamed protein product [Microthlaspi erraticum]|uniref:Uncharacterized protein n=1 Tax=Microthlaspi erraticum TaxID=1685480 RepID=A0A6D2IG53_9BRAS|nr:unnamed protein product [Microthlaspi erraticum]CAA7037997.1 unnamed protein product [Microthlaspi erraticum]
MLTSEKNGAKRGCLPLRKTEHKSVEALTEDYVERGSMYETLMVIKGRHQRRMLASLKNGAEIGYIDNQRRSGEEDSRTRHHRDVMVIKGRKKGGLGM